MKNEYDREIENRIKKLEKHSHPPVNWQELIYANIERIDKIEMDIHEFMEIIKHLVDEKKDLQKRLDVMEEILTSYIPEVKKNENT